MEWCKMDSIQLFKALGDKSRLRIVNTLRIEGPMYVELLSQRLELAQSTVSFHLKKLEECGIVKSNKEQYYVVFSLNTELLESKVIDLISNTNSDLDEQKEREIKYRNEVLKSYFKNGRLTSIPVQKEKKKIILEYIVRGLDAEESYTIGALNCILYKYTMDIEKLREELIQNSYLYSREGVFFLTNTAREKIKEFSIPSLLSKYVFKSEEAVLYIKEQVRVNIKSINEVNNVLNSELVFTDKGRVLIHLVLKNKVLGKLDYIYAYTYFDKNDNVIDFKSYEKIFGVDIYEKINGYDIVDNKKIKCLNKDNKIICTGEKLKVVGENGIGGIPTYADIKFELLNSEFEELVNKIKVKLFEMDD